MTSATRFQVTITTAGGDITPRSTPISLERISNRADRLVLEVTPFDRTQAEPNDAGYDISGMKGGDIVSFLYDGTTAFYGEIMDVVSVNDQDNVYHITAIDQIGTFAEKYLNRVIYNAYRDKLEWFIFTTRSQNLTGAQVDASTPSLTPVRSVQKFSAHGLYGNLSFGFGTGSGNLEQRISWDSSANQERIAIIFRPRSRTITKIWLKMLDPGGDNQFGVGTTAAKLQNVIVELTEVKDNVTKGIAIDHTTPAGGGGDGLHLVGETLTGGTSTATGVIVETDGISTSTVRMTSNAVFQPAETITNSGDADTATINTVTFIKSEYTRSAVLLDPVTTSAIKTRSVADAKVTLSTKIKETWLSATHAGGAGVRAISVSDLNWTTVRDNPLSTEESIIVADPAVYTMGSQNYAQLVHGTVGDYVYIKTTVPGTDPNPPPSGWASLRLRFPSNGIKGRLSIYCENNVNPIAEVLVKNNNLYMAYGDDDELEFVTGYSNSTLYTFHFRIYPKSLVFDLYYDTTVSSSNTTLVSENADFLNRDTFTDLSTKITEYRIGFDSTSQGHPADSAVGNIDVGWVNGCEIGLDQIINNWVQVDFSDDPIDTDVGHWMAINIYPEATLGAGATDNIIFNGIQANSNSQSSESRSLFARNGEVTASPGPDWEDPNLNGGSGTRLEFAHIIEYEDSWKDVSEGDSYSIDTENKTLNWVGDIPDRVYGLGSSGPERFKVSRVSEYVNPTSGGIIQSAHKMRVGDVFSHLESLHSNSPVSSVSVDSNYNTSDFDLDLYRLSQLSILDAWRDLARKYKGVFFLTAEASPTLHFNQAKLISSATDSPSNWNPADHEYVLSLDDDLFSDDDALIVDSVEIGFVETQTFTTFTAIGKDPQRQAKYINWALVTELGKEIVKAPDTFQNEEDINNLRLWVTAQNEVFGKRVIEGTITVSGFGPLYNGQLDVNSIIRLISRNIENGTDLTGTANVFRVTRVEYSADLHMTVLEVSNRDIHSPSELELEDLRKILDRTETTDTDDLEFSGLATGDIPAPSVAYMTLFIGTTEMVSLRPECDIFVRDDGYLSFSAYFPKGLASIPNDKNPIDKIAIYSTSSGAGELASITITDKIYKWEDNGLFATFDILET